MLVITIAPCKQTQHCWPTTPFAHPIDAVVGSCCAKFATVQTLSFVQKDTTTSNIAGPTMLGVVASVCT